MSSKGVDSFFYLFLIDALFIENYKMNNLINIRALMLRSCAILI